MKGHTDFHLIGGPTSASISKWIRFYHLFFLLQSCSLVDANKKQRHKSVCQMCRWVSIWAYTQKITVLLMKWNCFLSPASVELDIIVNITLQSHTADRSAREKYKKYKKNDEMTRKKRQNVKAKKNRERKNLTTNLLNSSRI